MSYLKQAREKLGLTQTAAATRLGIGRQALNRLEMGRAVATPAQACSLRELYGVAVLSTDDVEAGRRLLDRAGVRAYELEPVNPEPWRAAWKYWGGRMRVEPEVWQWLSQFMPADSSHECYGWGQFAARGARPMLGNPVQWGFDQHVLVDRLGNLLGARLLPALSFQSEDVDFVLWPQVWVCTGDHTFCLDGLVFFRVGDRRYWLVLELDGKGHNGSGDAFRRAQLQMMEVRISGDEIRAGRAFELFLERAAEAIRVGPPAAAPGFKTGWRRGRGARSV